MTFKITYRKSKIELEYCTEKHKNLSILDIAFDHDIFLKAGCRSGYCGTCQYILVSGDVKYFYDPPPTTADKDSILICSCYPTSDIIVDA
ncbi:MAG: 2Fe-2S iron-sulfur cluster-binding protein [Lentisphaeraceae bacterium]|nr:2Fe-2S iron-sulfur cluster-binding protein [Lentisphaeraceae bacterium]